MAFLDNIKDAVNTAVCSYVSGVDNANSWLQSVIPTTPDPPFISGLKGLACDDPTPPPSSPPPFEGGQCPGTVYTVSTIRGDDTGLFRPQVTGVVGPIQSIDYTRTPVQNDPTRTFIRMDVVAANGSFFDQLIYLHASGSPPSTSPDVAATSGPDDCGDPDPGPPPVFVPPTIVVPVPDPGGGPDIDTDVTIYAPVTVGPVVFAPVRVEGPDFNIDGRIILSPDFNIEVGLGGAGGGGGAPVAPEPNDDFDPESSDEPPSADGRRIIGLIVTLDFGPGLRATELSQDGDVAAIYVPRAAIAYLVSNNGGVRVPLSGVDLKLRNTYIPVPPDVEVVSWRVHTEPGVTVQNVRPVYGTTRPTT